MIATTSANRNKEFPRGAFAKVARIHRVSRQFVRMVAHGLKKSERIQATLQKYRKVA